MPPVKGRSFLGLSWLFYAAHMQALPPKNSGVFNLSYNAVSHAGAGSMQRQQGESYSESGICRSSKVDPAYGSYYPKEPEGRLVLSVDVSTALLRVCVGLNGLLSQILCC